MIAAPRQRWALSFADLCLLLLGFLLIVQARQTDRAAVAGSLRATFGRAAAQDHDLLAAALFAPGEAVLRPAARRRLQALARTAAAVRIESRGSPGGGTRLDRWELAAARTAAVARVMAEGGISPARIRVAVPEVGVGPQRLSIAYLRSP